MVIISRNSDAYILHFILLLTEENREPAVKSMSMKWWYDIVKDRQTRQMSTKVKTGEVLRAKDWGGGRGRVGMRDRV